MNTIVVILGFVFVVLCVVALVLHIFISIAEDKLQLGFSFINKYDNWFVRIFIGNKIDQTRAELESVGSKLSLGKFFFCIVLLAAVASVGGIIYVFVK